MYKADKIKMPKACRATQAQGPEKNKKSIVIVPSF